MTDEGTSHEAVPGDLDPQADAPGDDETGDPQLLERVRTAVADLHPRPDDPPSDVVVGLARAALRRLPAGTDRDLDVPSLARQLQAGARLLDGCDRTAAVATLAPGSDDPTAGTILHVASQDRPFLLSTVLDELERSGLRVRFQLHPIVGTTRDEHGRLTEVTPARSAQRRETLLHLELDRRLDDDEATELGDRLRDLVGDVHRATDDHDAMRAALRAHAAMLRQGAPAGLDEAATAEAADLVDWLLDDHAVLLGTRDYDLVDGDDGPALVVVADSGLGLLTDSTGSDYLDPVPLDHLDPRLASSLREPQLVAWSRTRRRSTVQRRVRMQHVAFTRYHDDGRPAGVLRLIALFTRKGEAAPADATPVLRRRLATVLESEDVVPGSHDEVVLTSLFQALPKDELFPRDLGDLQRVLIALLHAEEHREVRTIVRVDRATRTVSILVAVPRDTYSPTLRERLRDRLAARFDASEIEVAVSLGDRNEALARFLLSLDHDVEDVDPGALQREVRELARSWIEEVTGLLAEQVGASAAAELVRSVARRLPRSYRDAVDPRQAVGDLQLVAEVLERNLPLGLAWRRSDDHGQLLRLRAVKRGSSLELSAFLPILESLGLTVVEEVPHRLLGEDELHLHDFGVRLPAAGEGAPEELDLDEAGARLADAVRAAWRGHLEIDGLNRLVLAAGLRWRDVGVLRTYRRYRRQLGTPYTPAYVEQTLVQHADATTALVRLFRARFDPAIDDRQREARVADASEGFDEALEAVTRLDHDRILRGLRALVDATLRTNAFRQDAVADGTGEPYVAIKVDPAQVPDVPAPVPHREIFVRSPRVEGVHLRGGAVARGGLRWSDRQDDVRTEVLGLVKAQVLKNALIVPTGAKGGFVLMREPRDAEALRDEVRRQYVTFVRGLLDVTDGLRRDGDEDVVVPPPDVVRHDGDDPYLVVAADRGTATFSDTANGVAERYGFWLGDAFASGGSRGYDHKALGVTARGAWRAVARHFRELDLDVATEPITIAGVGDLSGDVFANGLLRSRAVQLVAAFDHRHVFLDPDPDPAASFEERTRVAALPRSSWDDYDRDTLSEGGMIVPRDVRSVTLTPQVRERLRLDVDELSPPALIRAVLAAPVDLLFAGGIGTYIRASTERDEDVGDRANDEVRVEATEVRARVVGEGANLFLTQRARIELARKGARVDQDAIHNAAGVATSDAEVNLKILLDLAIDAGELASDDRDAVLADLADDVVELVLDAVDRQVATLSAEAARGADNVDAQEAFIARLEDRGELDREVEVLPTTEELAERAEAGGGLTRPELATLLAWAKREVKEALLASEAPDDPVLADAVGDPLPRRAVARFGHLLPRHRLRRELVATGVANDLVDRMGITFASALAAETGADLPAVIRAYRTARATVDAPRWWAAVDALERDGLQDAGRIREHHELIDRLVADVTATVLTDPASADPAAVVERDRPVVEVLLAGAFELGTGTQRRARLAHARWLVDDLVDADLARFLACARDLATVPDVAAVAAVTPRSAADVADVAFRLGDHLGVDRLEEQLRREQPSEPWARRQQRGLSRDLRRLRRDAAAAAFLATPDVEVAEVVERFLADRDRAVSRALKVVEEAEHGDRHGLDAIAVAARAVREAVDRLQVT
ncbi:NAD-glutamate dehydrogenase [Nitriliruptoraceae bacterium ZYF776]|nr:NAD-glutamate dehydrogenase [Profundirhabdus halotolerans]